MTNTFPERTRFPERSAVSKHGVHALEYLQFMLTGKTGVVYAHCFNNTLVSCYGVFMHH
jgi:hypothetical protein